MNEISLHILDILQNSIKAGATLILVVLTYHNGILVVRIEDNGSGMSEDLVQKVCNPFVTTRTTRRVGLGLPLFKAGAEASGGSFSITSEMGKGTVVTASFDTAHIDCPPLGDMTGTMVSQFICHEDVEFVYSMETADGQMCFDTREVKAVLGGVSLNTPEVISWMQQSINEEINEIGGGNL